MEEMTKNVKKAIRVARRIDGLMLTALIALALFIPISIIVGDWLITFCNCVWIYIGVQWYKMREDMNDTTAEATEVIEAQDRLINKLSDLLHKSANEQGETKNEGKEAEQ